MTRKLLLILLLSLFTAFAHAQRAGSGADQIASFANDLDWLPTEGEFLGLPVNVHVKPLTLISVTTISHLATLG
ncbi:hypothetical protein [Polynucleobacter necessarius]|uniref:hypothetical protein n=1 Tax=Polynucleobacter necessarius TaxID=576610 RepID=UPI001E3EB541|nr:hypothetical protein [Polynucleobacter necessarius]